MTITQIYIVLSLVALVLLIVEFLSLKRRNAEQEATIGRLFIDIHSERNKRISRNLLAVLRCGAKVRFVEKEEAMDFPRGSFHEQAKPIREGGTFVHCNPVCPLRETCALVKAFGQFALPEGFALATATPGATLRADRDNRQGKLRLVRDDEKGLIDVVVDGVIFNDDYKAFLVFPPFPHVLDKSPEQNRQKGD